MKILLINKFFFPFGGTETALFQTAKLLREKGHEVIFFSMAHPKNVPSRHASHFVSRIDFEAISGWRQKIQGLGRMLFGQEAKRALAELLQSEKPDVAHLHNIYHHLSAAIITTLKKHGIPVIMTLHDYKVVCPAYKLLIRGKTCQRCRKGRFLHCALRKCVKNSRLKSLACSLESYLHRRHYRQVDCFISPSRFLQEKIREMGFAGKCWHVPNFVGRPVGRAPARPPHPVVLYFGRLVVEKGVKVLIEAMRGVAVECLIAGDGPLKETLRDRARLATGADIRFIGRQPRAAMTAIIRRSTMVVMPSIWFENSPFSILEAQALGVPIIASRIGGIPELVQHGVNGLTFEPGDSGDLRRQIRWLLDNPAERRRLGRNARQWTQRQNNPDDHYSRLMAIYASVASARPDDESATFHK